MAQPSLTMGTDEPSRVLLHKCEPNIHTWKQPIKFIPVISLYKGSISMDFFWICSYGSLHVMASNLKSGSSVPILPYTAAPLSEIRLLKIEGERSSPG